MLKNPKIMVILPHSKLQLIATMEFEHFSARLKHTLKILSISQTELARRIDVKPQVIQYLCAGKSEKTKFMFDIAEALQIDVKWLATGNGQQPSAFNFTKTETLIPILSLEQIKDWKISDKNINMLAAPKIPVQEDMNKNSFATILQDHSMLPRFSINTILIFDPQFTLDEFQNDKVKFVLIYLFKEGYVLFRQLSYINEEFILSPANTNLYKPFKMNDKDVILGVCKEARWNA